MVEVIERQTGNLVLWLGFDKENGTYGVIFSGTMDTTPVEEIKPVLQQKCFSGQYNYIVDTEGVSYVSSTGLRILTLFHQHRKLFALFSKLNDYIRKPFTLLGIDKFLQFYSNIDELKGKQGISDELLLQMKNQKSKVIFGVRASERWIKILQDYVGKAEAVKYVRELTPFIMKVDKETEITLPSEEKYSAVLYKFFEKAIRKEAKIPATVLSDDEIELAAREIMTNAVKHGYNYKKDGIIEASYKITSKELILEVTDYGVGMRPEAKVLSKGKGIPLLRRMFDAVLFDKPQGPPKRGQALGTGTRVQLIKYL